LNAIRVEENMRRSEDHLRLVIDTIPQQIWSGPPDGSLDFCNAQWRSFTGLTLEELQGEGWQGMLHPDDRERVLKAWRKSVANGTPYAQEERHRRSDGKYRWFLARGVALKDPEGRIVRWYGTNTDIEDRKEAEERLRLVIDTLPALVWSKLPDGSADFLNQRFREYTGLPVEEGLGWGWMMNAFHPEDRAEEEWRAAFAAGEPFEKEARMGRADGAYHLFIHRAVPLRDEMGNVVKWYGSTTDIEDRKRAEEALSEAKDKLARVTRIQAMAELAAAVAHEVNQPLTAMATNANFSIRQLNSSTPNLDEIRTAILEIVDDCARASAVLSRIRGLLMKGPPRRAQLEINEIIQQVITLLRNELTRNRVYFRTELAAGLPPVQGDPVQLQQVLINLVMNALEAMRLAAKQPRKLLIRSARNAAEVLVQVQDSGPGIQTEEAIRIFEPFFTTKPEGTGMGLSICRSVVESHGGRIWTVPNSTGALFEFTLPTNGDPSVRRDIKRRISHIYRADRRDK
jgi:PAS domain S-box-containing protein